MDIGDQWEQIRTDFNNIYRKAFYCSLATADDKGTPHISPIGSLFLRTDQTGYYFEQYPKRLPANLKVNNRVCFMVVNTSKGFFLKGLFKGKFETRPGIRLTGTAGERRQATEAEIESFQKAVRPYRWLKGHAMIWKNLKHVRDVYFDACEPIRFGNMTPD